MSRLLRLAEISTSAHYPVRCFPLAAGLAAAAAVLALRLTRRLEVVGRSMTPTLEPGDRVLAVRTRRVRAGDLVIVPDPRLGSRMVVKRVAAASAEGLALRGDNAAASTDSRVFGAVPLASVRGRVVYRYHPPARRGRIGAERRRAGTLRADAGRRPRADPQRRLSR
ncbi:MAG: nickel-type superoxide dismutase maturation protease [Actinomycetota bacterium]|nr:nickel-type superoxide dismutase maturation protease [Actinomycetota bacterium]